VVNNSRVKKVEKLLLQAVKSVGADVRNSYPMGADWSREKIKKRGRSMTGLF
jgi:hypothetical protein